MICNLRVNMAAQLTCLYCLGTVVYDHHGEGGTLNMISRPANQRCEESNYRRRILLVLPFLSLLPPPPPPLPFLCRNTVEQDTFRRSLTSTAAIVNAREARALERRQDDVNLSDSHTSSAIDSTRWPGPGHTSMVTARGPPSV